MQYGNANEKEDVVKIASKEMLKGSKMLGKHCKKCGFPLFEDKNGNIYCPNCNYNDYNSYKNNDTLEKEVKEKTGYDVKTLVKIDVRDGKVVIL